MSSSGFSRPENLRAVNRMKDKKMTSYIHDETTQGRCIVVLSQTSWAMLKFFESGDIPGI